MQERAPTWWQRNWRDFGGVASVVALALAYLSPALKDGARFGPFDFVIPLTSLGRGTYPRPPFNHVDSDAISQMGVWNLLDWRAVHAGHFPLWDGLSLLGVPHFLNFESSVLSLPDLVSYAVPITYAFFVAVLVKLLIAGTGAYVLARVLGIRPLGSSFAGITFMLSGAFANWLSWPLSDVVAWLGWILAFAILAYRSPGRVRHVVGLAVSVAFFLYGGFPEGNVFVAALIGVMGVVFLVARVMGGRGRRGSAAPTGSARGAPGIAVGLVSGAALAMPLWWPGVQILQIAHRGTEAGYPPLPPRALGLLLAQGYYGLPTGANPFFLQRSNYYESVGYVGIVVVVLAVTGLVTWWRHPTVIALAAGCVVVLLVAYQSRTFDPIQHVLDAVAGQVQWERFRSVLGLPLGLLGGIGLETMLRRPPPPQPGTRAAAPIMAFAAATVLAGAAIVVMALSRAAGPGAESVRQRSLIWPAALVALCAVAAIAAVASAARPSGPWGRRPGSATAAGCALWLGSATFLLFAGVGINGYSHTYYPSTAAIAELQRDVGSAVVGTDTGNTTNVHLFEPVGFYPDVNVAYGIDEFAGHDPVLPQQYFATFAPAKPDGGPGYFQPDIRSASQARRFGISFVLVAPYLPHLPGGHLVADIAGERLFSVPGAARFTLSGGGFVRSVVPQSDDSEYDLTTVGTRAGSLVARITDVPGWHATIDGRPADLVATNGVMWSLRVRSGRHRIRLWYWPERLGQGLLMAVGGGVLLIAFALVSIGRQRRRRDLDVGAAERGAELDPFSLAPLLGGTTAR